MNNEVINSSSNSSDSDFIGLTWSTYIWTIISLFGVLTNFINTCVLLSPKFTNSSYRYMLSNSITNFVYLSFLFMGAFFVACQNCLSSQTFFAACYTISIDTYFTSCLAFYRILVDITLAIRTLRILKNKKWLEKVSYKWILVCWFLFALIFYSPQPFSLNIYSWQNSMYGSIVLYYTDHNDFGESLVFKHITNVQTSIRLFCAVVVLSAINFLNVIEFKKRFIHHKPKLNLMQSTILLFEIF